MGTSKYKESAPNTYYHIYNRGNNQQNIFHEPADFNFYLKRLEQGLKKYNFGLIGYCLMPNHVHIILHQRDEYGPAKLISSVHTSYSMVFNKKYNLVGHLFQDRFKQKIITGDVYMKSLLAYVHLNPVKARLCKFPKEYEWSSYMEYAKPGISGICDKSLVQDWGLQGLAFEQYIAQANRIDPKDAFDED